MQDIKEEKARVMTTCPKCHKKKAQGLIVCWHCFKYRDNPLKDSDLPFEDWMKE